MIHIENLKYKYQGARQYVFDGFNLSLGDGNIYGLLGKNGTGKSTLLYLISGLLRRTAGLITVDGLIYSLIRSVSVTFLSVKIPLRSIPGRGGRTGEAPVDMTNLS